MSKTPEEQAEAEWYREKRILDIREWGITRQVTCSTCGAAVGYDCHTEPGWHPIPEGHAQRRKDARPVLRTFVCHCECHLPMGYRLEPGQTRPPVMRPCDKCVEVDHG